MTSILASRMPWDVYVEIERLLWMQEPKNEAPEEGIEEGGI